MTKKWREVIFSETYLEQSVKSDKLLYRLPPFSDLVSKIAKLAPGKRVLVGLLRG
jgi:hypothetical protein